jgi:hypothetical protein
MRFAYADPPYYGLAEKFYGHLHHEAGRYDTLEAHAELFALLAEFDGWAYSLHSPALRDLLPLAPADARVAAWVKPFASFKKGVNPAYCWEPVIFKSARGAKDREQPEKGGGRASTRDYLSEPIALKKGLTGAKPEAFCRWVFDLIGAHPGDEFVDLFPGSGAVSRAWGAFEMTLPADAARIAEQMSLAVPSR